MRFSAAVALCTAPLALAGSLDSVARALLPARDGHLASEMKGSNKEVAKEVQVGGGGGGATQILVSTTVIIIWINNGGGETTKQVSPTMQAPAATHTVKVGGPAGLVYSPDSLKAAMGDMVIFEFLSQNHTLTQSPFDTPCKKMADGMDSGFMANPNNTIVPAPQMAMQVTTDKPLWFYCRQKTHCGKGMVFSINPTADKTQAMFAQMAIAQNGTGAVPPIAGGSASAAPPAPPAATDAAPPPPASSVVPPPPAGTEAAPGGMASGIGNVGADGSCSCSCLCGVASFPNPGVQGRGMWGGMSGAMPMAALEK